jgi:hypothetical protein
VRLAWVFRGPLRVCVALLWLIGAALAGFTAPLAATRLGAVYSLAFAIPAIGLLLLLIHTPAGALWALTSRPPAQMVMG